MKEFTQRFLGAVLDLRVIVGICGILLSIAAHELFHIIVHWGEIDSVHIFPDTQAIVEVIFTPSTEYSLVVEEAFAYLITMVTLILTAMLIGDIHDARDERSVREAVLTPEGDSSPDFDEQAHLGRLLGISTTP